MENFRGALTPAPARGSAPGPRWGLCPQTPATARSAHLMLTHRKKAGSNYFGNLQKSKSTGMLLSYFGGGAMSAMSVIWG